MKNERLYYTMYACPIGTVRLRATDLGLVALDHVNQQTILERDWLERAEHPILVQAMRELDAYFAGESETFSVPLAPVGTDFQQSVWKALQAIPFGQTASYSEIAEQIDNPKSVRAVGAANGRNPLSIFIPCHRVIGKNGNLTGYAGGLDAKNILLNHERLVMC